MQTWKVVPDYLRKTVCFCKYKKNKDSSLGTHRTLQTGNQCPYLSGSKRKFIPSNTQLLYSQEPEMSTEAKEWNTSPNKDKNRYQHLKLQPFQTHFIYTYKYIYIQIYIYICMYISNIQKYTLGQKPDSIFNKFWCSR